MRLDWQSTTPYRILVKLAQHSFIGSQFDSVNKPRGAIEVGRQHNLPIHYRQQRARSPKPGLHLCGQQAKASQLLEQALQVSDSEDGTPINADALAEIAVN